MIKNEQIDFLKEKKEVKKKEQKPISKLGKLRDVTSSLQDSIEHHKQIMGNLISEGDVVLFWGPSGTGKSILSYQLAEAVASGRNFFDIITPKDDIKYPEAPYYELVNELPPSNVLYVDFEMSPEQITYRYSRKDGNGNKIYYQHHPNLHLLTFLPETFRPKDFIEEIEKRVQEIEARFLIIDNLSSVSTDMENADKARDFMMKLKNISEKYNMTLFVVTHTNKLLDRYQVKEAHMMKGSSNIDNLSTAQFCISPSRKDPNIRYIKQFKCRFEEKQFTEVRVIEVEIGRDDTGNIGYSFLDYSTEDDMLTELHKDINELLRFEIEQRLKKDKNTSIYGLAKELYQTYGNGKKIPTFKKQVQRIVKDIQTNPATINQENQWEVTTL